MVALSVTVMPQGRVTVCGIVTVVGTIYMIDNKCNGRESFAAQQICVVSIFGINSMWVKYIFIVVSWSMNASMMCCLCCAKINN